MSIACRCVQKRKAVSDFPGTIVDTKVVVIGVLIRWWVWVQGTVC